MPWPLHIQVDNQAGISFQHSTCPNGKLLGTFDLRGDWVKELKNLKQINTVKVATEYNLADLLTKCHPATRFTQLMQFFRAKAGMSARSH